MGIAAGTAVWPWVKVTRSKIDGHRLYTVKVPGGPGSDGLYDDLQEWVLSLLKPGQQKALVAYVSQRGRHSVGMPFDDGGFSARRRAVEANLRLRYDGSREQQIVVRGHKVKINISDGNPAGGEGMNQKWRPPELVFSASSQEARDAVIEEIAAVMEANRAKQRQPVFRMLNQWDEWERIDDLPDRALDSVILPAGQLERVTGDIESFLASEDLYVKRSVPWHRGHLYEGPPGTGKTSVARAMACHFGLDVWYLPLADVKKDTSLIKTVMGVKSKSLLLLEDVDIFHAATSRQEGFGGTTLSGLLNSLDGIATPHGLITVMTTNTPEVLDDALVRAGRVDLVEHFGLAKRPEVERLISHWYEKDVRIEIEGFDEKCEIAPSDVTEICKRHTEPFGAIAEITARLS